MALQLKNKAKEEQDSDKSKKSGKYKRKRNVFGKSLTRFGLIGLIGFLVVTFAVVKVVATLKQNKNQKKINENLEKVEAKIKADQRELNRTVVSYENVGKLIATLPVNFDQQATSIDLDRIVTLSGLTENQTTAPRKIDQNASMPISCSIDTIKAVKIDITLYGKNGDVDSVLKLMDYLTDYNHENFYYIDNVSYVEDWQIYRRSTTIISVYTFYNNIDLSQQ